MDIKHVLSVQPAAPAYARVRMRRHVAPRRTPPARRRAGSAHPGGRRSTIGHDGPASRSTTRSPRHTRPSSSRSRLADRPVTCGEWLAFIDDGGYGRAELWLSDGWATVQADGWDAPLYWLDDGDGWSVFTLDGPQPVDPAEPGVPRQLLRGRRLRPLGRRPAADRGRVGGGGPRSGRSRGDSSTCAGRIRLPARPFVGERAALPLRRRVGVDRVGLPPVPGFRPAAGAVGEYNGKFMVNQHVLRGGCCATPRRPRPADLPQLLPALRALAVHRAPPGPLTRLTQEHAMKPLDHRRPSSRPVIAATPSSATPALGLTSVAQVPAAGVVLRRARQPAVRRDHPAARVLPHERRAVDPRCARAERSPQPPTPTPSSSSGRARRRRPACCSTRWPRGELAALRALRRERGGAARRGRRHRRRATASTSTPWSATSTATSTGIPTGGRRLVAFLGSTIGNLRPVERRRFFPDRPLDDEHRRPPAARHRSGQGRRRRLARRLRRRRGRDGRLQPQRARGPQHRARRRLRSRQLRPRRLLERARTLDRDAAAFATTTARACRRPRPRGARSTRARICSRRSRPSSPPMTSPVSCPPGASRLTTVGPTRPPTSSSPSLVHGDVIGPA